jgi:hypothetical protein
MKQCVAACTVVLFTVGCNPDTPTPPHSTATVSTPHATDKPHTGQSDAAVHQAPDASPDAASSLPERDCAAVVDCAFACDTDACIDACGAGASEASIDQAVSVITCAVVFACGDDDCLTSYCAAEILECTGTTLPEADASTSLPDAGSPSGDGGGALPCELPSGPGTEHSGFIESDEVWTAEDSPHMITSSVSVRGARVTIQPCAVVQLESGQSIFVGQASGDAASLVAVGEKHGSVTRPVVFTSSDASEYWGGIVVNATGSTDLAYATLQRGGHPDGHGFGHASALSSHGDDNRLLPLANISAKHVAIVDSASLGFSLEASGAFSEDSTDLTVTGSGSQGGQSGSIQTTYAGYVEAPSIHSVPEGDYTGNAIDAIEAYAPFTLEVDETFHERGVPYQVIGSFYMRPGTPNGTTTLTIEAGTTLLFSGEEFPDGRLVLGDAGAGDDRRVRWIADGTPEAPIVLTSGMSTPAAGDWLGITWDSAPATGNIMNYVTVEYGGGNSGANGFGCGPGENDALLFLGWEPAEPFIQNSTFQASLEGGIVSAWDSDVASVDLASGNVFDAIGNGCNVSVNKSAEGACPDNGGAPSCY